MGDVSYFRIITSNNKFTENLKNIYFNNFDKFEHKMK